ncbi:MAG: hypothetical protein HQL70_05820 [Magnetococcales bacterium]|nr:hypothetical protein [Magnetococcales bacterium]
MEEPIILYCKNCNPERHHQEDRRKSAEIIPIRKNKRQPKPDRRKVLDRRLKEIYPVNRRGIKRSIGRRPFDGKSWFIGTIEDAIKEQWATKNGGKEILCPRCNNKLE